MNGLHEYFLLLHTLSLCTYMKTSMYYVFCLYILHLLKQGLPIPYWLVNVAFSIFSLAFEAERCPISYKHICSYSVLPHFMFREKHELGIKGKWTWDKYRNGFLTTKVMVQVKAQTSRGQKRQDFAFSHMLPPVHILKFQSAPSHLLDFLSLRMNLNLRPFQVL